MSQEKVMAYDDYCKAKKRITEFNVYCELPVHHEGEHRDHMRDYSWVDSK